MSSFPKWPSEWKAWSNECNGVAYDPCWNRNSDCICDVCDLVCDVCDLVTKGCVEFFALGVKPQLKFIGLLPSHLSPALKTENSCRHHETQTVTQKRINYLLTLCISIEQCLGLKDILDEVQTRQQLSSIIQQIFFMGYKVQHRTIDIASSFWIVLDLNHKCSVEMQVYKQSATIACLS